MCIRDRLGWLTTPSSKEFRVDAIGGSLTVVFQLCVSYNVEPHARLARLGSSKAQAVTSSQIF
eukprot:8916494-Pyramimonas_sp.AAC.1